MRAALTAQSESSSCRRKASWRQFRIIVSVDEVVGDSRVLRIAAVKRLEEVGRLFLVCVTLVDRRCVGQKGERVKHLRFDIFPVL